MYKDILKIAVPAIISNIAVPLLGLLDLAIAGHLGATAFIGAVAVGAMMFNLTYWNLGFLRMGTSGMTAQAFGAGNREEAARLLYRASALALAIGTAIILLQQPLQWVLLTAIAPDAEVTELARSYFFICVWGAPAMLGTMSLSGWCIGMQNSTYPMIVSITVNIVNIVASLACVFLLDMRFLGIPTGTLIAQWTGFLLNIAFCLRIMRRYSIPLPFHLDGILRDMRKFFSVNSDIFLRSLCMMLVMLFFTAAGARSGKTTLAVNAVIMQMFTLYSYFMDGFAYAGEAIAGKHVGAGNRKGLTDTVKALFLSGSGVMLAFTLLYGLAGNQVMGLITDDADVLRHASHYRLWSAAVPVAGMAAFIWDGIFIGMTASRQMLTTVFLASASFFVLYFGVHQIIPDPNNRLWLAFISYLAIRGIIQLLIYRRMLRKEAWKRFD